MQEKVVVITGASGGIGAALAQVLAARGASLVLVARRADALNEVAARCGARAHAVVADVTHRAEVRGVVEQAIGRFGHIDVWVNNVGQGISTPPSYTRRGAHVRVVKVYDAIGVDPPAPSAD